MQQNIRSSPAELFFWKCVLKACGKFSGKRWIMYSTWVSSCKFVAYFRTRFIRTSLGDSFWEKDDFNLQITLQNKMLSWTQMQTSKNKLGFQDKNSEFLTAHITFWISPLHIYVSISISIYLSTVSPYIYIYIYI